MKTILHILTIGFLTFFSCGQADEKNNVSLITTDTFHIKPEREEEERLEKRKAIEEQANKDSIMLAKVLKDALAIATQNIGKNKFFKEYELMPDSAYNVKVEISLDKHFTKFYPHLIIRRYGPNAVYIDIYTKNDSKFEKILAHEQWSMEYINDTIRDINGDGFNDFVVNWYGTNGCCLKAFSNVYLIRSDKKTFSDNFEFINPTFSPEEKIIRGVCYGHPGETEMYKYKWKEEKVDTLEYISYQKSDKGVKTGKVIISTERPYNANSKILKIVRIVPTEYRKIEGYDWFTAKGYE